MTPCRCGVVDQTISGQVKKTFDGRPSRPLVFDFILLVSRPRGGVVELNAQAMANLVIKPR